MTGAPTRYTTEDHQRGRILRTCRMLVTLFANDPPETLLTMAEDRHGPMEGGERLKHEFAKLVKDVQERRGNLPMATELDGYSPEAVAAIYLNYGPH